MGNRRVASKSFTLKRRAHLRAIAIKRAQKMRQLKEARDISSVIISVSEGILESPLVRCRTPPPVSSTSEIPSLPPSKTNHGTPSCQVSTASRCAKRHIVDGRWLIEQALKFEHFPQCERPPNSVKIISEERTGLMTKWQLKCDLCGKSQSVLSEPKDTPLSTNQAVINATMHSGIGYADSHLFLLGLGVYQE